MKKMRYVSNTKVIVRRTDFQSQTGTIITFRVDKDDTSFITSIRVSMPTTDKLEHDKIINVPLHF